VVVDVCSWSVLDASRVAFAARHGPERTRNTRNSLADHVAKQVIQATGDARDLRPIALFCSRLGAVGVDLCGCGVLGVGAAAAQEKRFHGVNDDSILSHRLANDVTFGIRGGNVRDGSNSFDHGGVPLRLGIQRIADQVKAVRDDVRRVGRAVTSAFCGTKFRLVGVGGLVKIYVDEKFEVGAERCNEIEHSDGFFAAAVRDERAVGVDGVGVPPLNNLVGPGADAGDNENIEVLSVLLHACLHEQDGTLHAAGLVAMNASSDQNVRLADVPIARSNGEQRELLGIDVIQRSVLGHVKLLFERLKLCKHFLLIRAFRLANARFPQQLLLGAPCNAWRSDWKRPNV
jgi:hypothetical protein